MARTEDQRLMALAVQLATSNSPCTLPALSAEAIPDATSGIWSIECVEGSYTLILSDDGTTEPSRKVQP